MKKINEILSISALLLFGVASVWGQESHNLTGKILSNKNKPVEGAIVTVMDTMNVSVLSERPFESKRNQCVGTWIFFSQTIGKRPSAYHYYDDTGRSLQI